MKRIIMSIVAMMMLCSGFAFASEGVEVEAGIKMWNNKWTSEEPGIDKTKYDAAILVGPSVEVKFPSQFFIEASYLMSVTDYESTYFIHKITADRKDLDLAVGYALVPSFGVFVGYKSASMDWDMDLAGTIIDSRSMDLAGPMAGIRGNAELNDMFSIYGNLTYLMTKVEKKGTYTATTSEKSPGTVWELGVKAKFSEELSGTLGYKVEATKEDKTNTKDTFSGLTLGVMYAF